MKRLLILFFLFFISCTSIKFSNNKDLFFYGNYLQIGDILLKKREFNFTSLFGHTALVIGNNKVADIPKFGEKYYETSLESWLQDEREVIVLRHPNNSLAFKLRLLKNLEDFKNTKYSINFNKYNVKGMYCSQFIWYLFLISANDLGYALDIDGDQGNFIFPYDFLKSSELEIIFFR